MDWIFGTAKGFVGTCGRSLAGGLAVAPCATASTDAPSLFADLLIGIKIVIVNHGHAFGVNSAEQGAEYFRCQLHRMERLNELVLSEVALLTADGKCGIKVALQHTWREGVVPDRHKWRWDGNGR